MGGDLKVWLLMSESTMLLHVRCSIAHSECFRLSLSADSIALQVHGKTSLFIPVQTLLILSDPWNTLSRKDRIGCLMGVVPDLFAFFRGHRL